MCTTARYRGWPVAPTHVQHPVRGAFLDPRGVDDTGLSGYHFGIDVSIDDRHPEAGAPAGLSHRVYAVESGHVSEPKGDQTRPCLARRLQVGHFAYWHVSPVVAARAYVKAGQQIGWSCLGVWHVHVSEWQRFQGRQVWVNPLHRGGRIAPYVDTAAPFVNTLVFVTPPARPWLPTKTLAQPDTSTRLSPNRLHGLVELRANIGDPQSYLGFLNNNAAWPTVFTPYRVSVTIRSLLLAQDDHASDELPGRPATADRLHRPLRTGNDRGRQHAGMRRPSPETGMRRHVLAPTIFAIQTGVLEYARNAQRPLRHNRSCKRPGREQHGKNGKRLGAKLGATGWPPHDSVEESEFRVSPSVYEGEFRPSWCGRSQASRRFGSARGSIKAGTATRYALLDGLPA